MDEQNRLIVCKILTGSRLFGTFTPSSDTDYTGVFIPSRQELLGLENPPSEISRNLKVSDSVKNTALDTDCKYFSVRRFIDLASQGQSAPLEMLFAPKEYWIESSPLWEEIVANRHLFLSKRGVAPMLGFANAQAYRACIKGENLNKLKDILARYDALPSKPNGNLGKNTEFDNRDEEGEPLPGGCTVFGVKLEYKMNQQGYPLIKLAGRDYDPGIHIGRFISLIRDAHDQYGKRVHDAAEDGYDYKSLLHCIRQLKEAEEFLSTGFITLPRPPEERDFLMSIKRKEWPPFGPDQFFEIVASEKARIETEVYNKSSLPVTPDRGALSRLCAKLNGYNL